MPKRKKGKSQLAIAVLTIIFVSLLGLGFLLRSSAATQDANGCEPLQTIGINGKSRQFIVHQPSGISGKPAAVILLHGSSGNACTMESYNPSWAETWDAKTSKRFEDVADQNKFLAIYATALPNGNGITSWQSNGHNTEDTQFISALIDRAIGGYNADPSRIYVVGNSSGAFMSYALACDLPGRLAGAVAVSGSFYSNTLPDCHPSRAIPFLDLTSTKDTVQYSYCASLGTPTVACNGNTSKAYDSSYAISQLASIYKCSGSTNNWDHCGGGNSAVVQLQLTNTCTQTNCHAWHGVYKDASGNHEYNVSQTVWGFLASHGPSSDFTGGGSATPTTQNQQANSTSKQSTGSNQTTKPSNTETATLSNSAGTTTTAKKIAEQRAKKGFRWGQLFLSIAITLGVCGIWGGYWFCHKRKQPAW